MKTYVYQVKIWKVFDKWEHEKNFQIVVQTNAELKLHYAECAIMYGIIIEREFLITQNIGARKSLYTKGYAIIWVLTLIIFKYDRNE